MAKYLFGLIFSVLSTELLAVTNTCNYGLIGLDGDNIIPTLLAEDKCNVWDICFNDDECFHESLSFSCSANNTGYLTYYADLECSNMTSVVEASVYYCCSECSDTCDEIPVIITETNTSDCSGTVLESSMTWYSIAADDICGGSGSSTPVSITITDELWKYVVYNSGTTGCEDGDELFTVRTTSNCFNEGSNRSTSTNFNNNTMADITTTVMPTTTIATTIAEEDTTTVVAASCDEYATFTIDFTVYDATGDVTSNELSSEDWDTIMDSIFSHASAVTVTTTNSSSGGGDSEGESSDEGGSCAELSVSVSVEFDTCSSTDCGLQDIVDDIVSSVTSEMTVDGTVFVQCYDTDCCDDACTAVEENADDCQTVSYTCEADDSTDDDGANTVSVGMGYIIGGTMLAFGLFRN